MYGDGAICVNNSANVTLCDVHIDGTYSFAPKYGYGVNLNNVNIIKLPIGISTVVTFIAKAGMLRKEKQVHDCITHSLRCMAWWSISIASLLILHLFLLSHRTMYTFRSIFFQEM